MPDYQALLEGWGFGRIQRRGDELIADCALCNRKHRFYLNTEKGMAICFGRDCFTGSVVSLIALMEGCSFREAKAKLNEGVDWFTHFSTTMGKHKPTLTRQNPISMPKTRGLNHAEINFLNRRKVSVTEAVKHGARGTDDLPGMVSAFNDCTKEDAESLIETFPNNFNYMKDRVLWPINLPDGSLCSIEARSIHADGKPKVIYPTGINAKQGMFPVPPDGEWIVVVEGLLDALTIRNWGFPGSAMFSSAISLFQSAALHRYERVYGGWDADKGGRDGMLSMVSRLYHGAALYDIKLPKGKDPNDCTFPEFERAFIKAKRVTDSHPSVKKWLKQKSKKRGMKRSQYNSR